MDETKEIAEKGGLTFKELFIVFKRLWLVLLAVIMILGASITLLAEKRTKPVYYATITLAIKANTPEAISNLSDGYIALLNEGVLKRDVNYKYLKETMYKDNPAVANSFTYLGNYDNVNFDGSISAYNGGGAFLYLTYASYHGYDVARDTLLQIVNSLINVSNMTSDEGNYLMANLAGHITPIDKNVGTWSARASTNKYTLIGIVLGVIIDVAILLLVYKLDDTIKTKEELERLTGVQFITYIEDIEEEGGSKY